MLSVVAHLPDNNLVRGYRIKIVYMHLGGEFQYSASTVQEVQADGDELTRILATCINLPQTESRIQTWYGDMAKFIMANVRFT